MAVIRRFICCLLYWAAINGIGECVSESSPNKLQENEAHNEQHLDGYVTDLRYEDRATVKKYTNPTSQPLKEDVITYGSTVALSSPEVFVSSKDQEEYSEFQGIDMEAAQTPRHTSDDFGRQGNLISTRKKRVVASGRVFRYRKTFHPEETAADLSENPPSYIDEDTKGSKKKKNKHGRGNRNRKQGGRKKINIMTQSGHALEEELNNAGSNKGGRTKGGKSKKLKNANSQDGQSNRRFRQHMQHKKKVKQFLQKRIQEQIAQRRHRRGSLAA